MNCHHGSGHGHGGHHGHHSGSEHHGCGCEHHGESHHQGCCHGHHHGRMFLSKDEQVTMLEEYLEQLRAEVKGAEEKLAELKQES